PQQLEILPLHGLVLLLEAPPELVIAGGELAGVVGRDCGVVGHRPGRHQAAPRTAVIAVAAITEEPPLRGPADATDFCRRRRGHRCLISVPPSVPPPPGLPVESFHQAVASSSWSRCGATSYRGSSRPKELPNLHGSPVTPAARAQGARSSARKLIRAQRTGAGGSRSISWRKSVLASSGTARTFSPERKFSG